MRTAGGPATPDDRDEILRHWREGVPEDRLAHLVRDCTRAFQRALTARLAAHDVSFGHWTFLRVLWERDGITQRALSQRAGVMEPTTFAAVTAMEKRGYVSRRHRAGNRKNVYIHLTRAGRALERRLVPLAVEVNRIGVRGVPAADQRTARRVLLAIIANLARDERAAVPARTQRANPAGSRAAAARG
ncbi:MAG: MarR family transcriptional regulator [Burkholderiales bacterium]